MLFSLTCMIEIYLLQREFIYLGNYNHKLIYYVKHIIWSKDIVYCVFVCVTQHSLRTNTCENLCFVCVWNNTGVNTCIILCKKHNSNTILHWVTYNIHALTQVLFSIVYWVVIIYKID